MTPEFAQAVDPVFLHVLRLLERLDNGEGPSVAEVRRGIMTPLNQADTVLRNSEDWKHAKYALVVWIDDVLIDSRWEHNRSWAEPLLEFEIYGTSHASTQFYTEAEEARRLPKSDALEVFYVCVVLGFRGIYRDPVEAEQWAYENGLPPTLEAWTKQTAKSIRAGKGLPSFVGNTRPGAGVPALRGYSKLCWTSLGAVVATLTLTFAILIWFTDPK